MKALIIAEKPSVASDIAKALGGFKKSENGVWEGERALVSNAIGHLVGIAAPEAIANKTPVIPEVFALEPLPKTADQLKLLCKLLQRTDVTSVINACDAGREGELIFRRIMDYAKCSKPVRRMWLQSMTPQAIRDGYARQRSDAEMLPLAAAAVARSEADWIVGINGSRFCKRLRGDSAPVGRVQTPTLMIIVDREEARRSFVKRVYFEVHAQIGLLAGAYVGIWNNPEPLAGDPVERIWDKAQADAIARRCQGRAPDRIEEQTKPSKRGAPTLFDLTTLQREANRLFGMSAQNTLAVAQALYEKHKVLTYPRTDATALPEDYVPTVTRTVDALAAQGYAEAARRIIDNGWIKPTKRIFNNAKISDHFAIIPTGKAPAELTATELKIYDLVARRLLAAFHPDAEYAVTIRTALIGSDAFVARGRVLTSAGWLAVYQADEESKDDTPRLPTLSREEKASNLGVSVEKGETKPPKRFNEATLLSAMENAGKDVDDDALREAMMEKGLGTPATRAAIIEKLLAEDYIVREKRELVPTEKAFELKTLLLRMNAEALLSAELTGQWEAQLKAIESGRGTSADFMSAIKRFTLSLAEKSASLAPAEPAAGSQFPCTSCGKPMRRKKGAKGYFWGCSDYPTCNATAPDDDGKPGQRRQSPAPRSTVPIPCPSCHKPLRLLKGSRGPFWGCTGYNDGCRYTAPDDNGTPAARVQDAAGKATAEERRKAMPPAAAPTDGLRIGDECPTCRKGKLTQRKATVSERYFLGCTCYPTCRYFKWQ
jgi:DNA topoisomerase-3